MCGIAGIIDFKARPVDPQSLRGSYELLAHRGPDDRGTWQSQGSHLAVGLAHTRLAVIDPSPIGHQPMTDSLNRWVIVFNGTIYNYRELRTELEKEGCRFRTQTDTEVLLLGYIQWGTKFLSRLNGMWSFCIYDIQEQVGLLCRDPFGIKPLVYSPENDRLIFASEWSAMRALGHDQSSIDPRALAQYLRFGYIPHPHSIYQNSYKLPPGHFLAFDSRGPQPTERYYDLRVNPDLARLSYPDACELVRQRLDRSVKARLVADVPLGSFLSGGLDSSIITCHLAEYSNLPPKTFSIGYQNQDRYDESTYAAIAAQHFGTDHASYKIGFDEVIRHLPLMLDHLSEPFADASLIPTSLVSAYTRQQVTVALSGDAGDELFGGYYRYVAHGYWRRYQRYPKLIREFLVEPLAGLLSSSKSGKLGNHVRQFRKMIRTRSGNSLARHQAWSRILSPEAEKLMDPHQQLSADSDFGTTTDLQIPMDLLAYWNADPLNQIMLLDLHHQLPGDMLLKVDLASMFHHLEVRVPFLDPEVVELAVSLPSNYKIEGKQRKKILKDAYRGLLPQEVLSRDKMGFELPIGEFLRSELREMFFDVVTPVRIGQLPPLDYKGVQQLYEQHDQKKEEHADILYALLVLCWWKSRQGK